MASKEASIPTITKHMSTRANVSQMKAKLFSTLLDDSVIDSVPDNIDSELSGVDDRGKDPVSSVVHLDALTEKNTATDGREESQTKPGQLDKNIQNHGDF